MQSSILEQIQQCVVDGENEEVAGLVEKALAQGIEPLSIVNDALVKGINVVGEEYQQGSFFLPDLVLGAKAMEAGLAVIQPHLMGKQQRKVEGRLLIGTVHGDLHDIGKNIVGTLFRANGFEVHDLGVDVSTARFVEKIRELKPDLVGLSALLTTTVRAQKDLIETLIEEGLRDKVKVLVGGAPITREWAKQIGADGYGADAAEAVSEAKKLLA